MFPHTSLINSLLPWCLIQAAAPAAKLLTSRAAAVVHVHQCTCKRAAEGTAGRGDQSASQHDACIPNDACTGASWLCSSPLPVRYTARPAREGDLELQLEIRGYNSQANSYFPLSLFICFKDCTLLFLPLCDISIICSKANQSFTRLTIWFNLHTAKKDKGSP